MNADSSVTVSAAGVALTQLAKWAGIPDKLGPLAVLLLAALGVGIWAYSQTEAGLPRQEVFNLFAGWIAVATSSAGVFGFTRAAAASVTKASPPPAEGAGSSRTTDA
jgi:hypothetical protein